MAGLNGADSAPGRAVVFGEVLFDRFPDGSEVLGGAPFNVAWNLAGLGAQPVLVSRVGADELGRRVLAAMGEWGLESSAIQVDELHPTGTVEVLIEEDEPRFEIVSGRAYDFIDRSELPALEKGAILYHGSLVCRSSTSRRALTSVLRTYAGPRFFDVNLRPPFWHERTLRRLLSGASEVKMNEDELMRLSPFPSTLAERAAALLTRLAIEKLYVTRGARGAVAFSTDAEPVEVRPCGNVRVLDTVGAGDAFSAVLILGRLRRWPLAATLERAQEFAAAVVGLRGATTTDRGFYEPFASAWGDWSR